MTPASSEPSKHRELAGDLTAAGLRFAILVSRFNAFVTERLLSGALDALVRAGAKSSDLDVVRVPGAMEIPLAAQVAADGITVNSVLPSVIDTPANRRAMPGADPSLWVKPEEIARLMLFLCTDAAKEISGAAIPIYGRA